MNFGSIEFGAEQSEQLDQQRGHDEARREYVDLRTLDSYDFASVDLIKIDVEGMEADVLKGGRELIERCRPIMLVEFIKSDANALVEQITGWGYKVYVNGIDLLCLPTEFDARIFPQA
jgi:hypothetical protein